MVGAGTEMTHFFRDRHALERLPVRLEELFALGVPACLHAIDLRGGPLVHGQAADKAEVRAERAVRPAALEAERDGERGVLHSTQSLLSPLQGGVRAVFHARTRGSCVDRRWGESRQIRETAAGQRSALSWPAACRA